MPSDHPGQPCRSTPPTAVARFAANAAAVAAVLVGKGLIAAGLRRPHEGWRRTVGILLRSESTRFALSAFGLRVPDGTEDLEGRTARALSAFLSTEPDAHFALAWQKPLTRRRRMAFVDIVVLRFGPDGSLAGLTPVLSPGGPSAPPPHLQDRVHAAVVTAYARSAGLPELERPTRLRADLFATLSAAGGGSTERRYADRLLAAACLSFEQGAGTEGMARFRPPSFARRRTLGLGYLSWVARLDNERDAADLWVSAHHVGLDGVPLQDLLNRLEQAWGVVDAPTFPEATAPAAFVAPEPCHAPLERAVDQLLAFVDLSPIVALRRRLNEQRRRESGEEVTLGALLAWLFSQEPEFRGVRIASTVDVAASSGYERDVDVVSLRAADFMTGDGPWGGFAEYVGEFNRLVAAARTRTSPVRVGMQTAGLIPPWAHATIVQSNPARLDDTFGTLCITIVRDARVFVAPMTDLGLGHGFFAIGNVNLPTASGARVAAVTVKGDQGRIDHYPQILQRVVAHAGVLLRQ